jgi:hypothetical protein
MQDDEQAAYVLQSSHRFGIIASIVPEVGRKGDFKEIRTKKRQALSQRMPFLCPERIKQCKIINF